MDLTEIRVFEEQKVGTLKLSEAIRIGAKMHPSHGTEYFNGCAIHCAALAIGCDNGIDSRVKQTWPELSRSAENPMTHVAAPLRTVISWLNGYEGGQGAFWTREQIADWLEAQGY